MVNDETAVSSSLRVRAYREAGDLAAVWGVLEAGWQAERAGEAGSFYVHRGDVSWWLFYLNQPDDPREHLFLWEAEGQVAGWSLLSPRAGAFDVFVHPALHGSEQAGQMWAWTEARLCERLRAARAEAVTVCTQWVADDDEWLSGWLRSRGFTLDPNYALWCLERSLGEELPRPEAPAGFDVRPVADPAEARPRALAARAAFGSRLDEAAYVERYRRFMRSPAYGQALDLAAVTTGEDGQPCVAAFAIAWPDMPSGAGLFEPVGTMPVYQRRGLGRAVMLDGLRRLQAAGHTSARVCVEHDNLAAVRLYEAVGFEPLRKLTRYWRRVE
jgi:ribosomal protein S18 acetylase RimI-like enzyme